ncbi:hypothetical protein LTR15_007105 [Elasticomyces elasticus]|nr:hypothetical protein LTR15_007105 [Elasticomyces elasticus]
MVKLPEVAPDTFELYAAWVYHGKIDHEALRIAAVIIQQDQRKEQHGVEDENEFWSMSTLDLMKLHVAADFLGHAALMKRAVDGVLDLIAAKASWMYRLLDIVTYVWGATASTSGLRRIVLDYVVFTGAYKSMRHLLQVIQPHVPSEFFTELAFRSLEASGHSDTSEFRPLPVRRHRYYEGYESAKKGETTQQDA